jgi:hypothetical protein
VVRENRLNAKSAPRTAIFYPYVTALGKHARQAIRTEFATVEGFSNCVAD